jgi:aminobenzoyl-glutamate utilization protein A
MAARMKGGFTGVVGVLEGRGGRGGGPTVALRFDIDANAGEEARDDRHRPAREGFASAEPGTMHNCGHDGHAAIGLGVASLLGEIRDAWTGRVKVIFQPAEEGARGARAMIETGVLDDADYLIAPHVGVRVTRTGKIVCGAGGFQATTKLDAVFTGRNAHAGLEPEAGRNALAAAATAFLQLQAISRHGGGGTRVNVGMLEGGAARNIIPDRAVLKLETRGETSDLDAYMQDRAHEVLRAAALMHGVEVEIEGVGRTISAQSDPELAGVISEVASDLPDFDEVVLEEDFGAGDDATFMMERVRLRGGKSAYLVLGTELPGGHHTSRFDFNEEVLVSGVKLFASLVCRLSGGA